MYVHIPVYRGEAAFRAMAVSFGWAKHPMIHRMDDLRKDISITLLYGSRSWVDNTSGEIIREKRPDSYVNVQVCLPQFIKIEIHVQLLLEHKIIKKFQSNETFSDLKSPSIQWRSSLCLLFIRFLNLTLVDSW
jgi:hypothetical protein